MTAFGSLPFPLTALGHLAFDPGEGLSVETGLLDRSILVVEPAPSDGRWPRFVTGIGPLLVLVVELSAATHPTMLVEKVGGVQFVPRPSSVTDETDASSARARPATVDRLRMRSMLRCNVRCTGTDRTHGRYRNAR